MREIGFTGTQRGMTEHQLVAVDSLLALLCIDGGHVHHGDCIGADAQFHDLAEARGLRIEIHPPVDEKKRAFKKGDLVWPQYEYMIRNEHIVACTDVLIATPGEPTEQLRSGTWATVRRARAAGSLIYIVNPNGHIVQENP